MRVHGAVAGRVGEVGRVLPAGRGRAQVQLAAVLRLLAATQPQPLGGLHMSRGMVTIATIYPPDPPPQCAGRSDRYSRGYRAQCRWSRQPAPRCSSTHLARVDRDRTVGHLKAPYLWPPSVVCPPQPMAMFSSSLSTHLKLPTLLTQVSEAASGFLRFRSWMVEGAPAAPWPPSSGHWSFEPFRNWI